MPVTKIRSKWVDGELVFYDEATGNEIFRIKDGTGGVTFTEPVDVLSDGDLKLAGTAITATAAELNKLDGALLTTAQMNFLAAVVAGTVAASKAIVVDANKRTGIMSGMSMLLVNGRTPIASAEDLYLLAIEVENGLMTQEGLAEWMSDQSNVLPLTYEEIVANPQLFDPEVWELGEHEI